MGVYALPRDVRWSEAKRRWPLVKTATGVRARLLRRRGIWHLDYEDRAGKRHERSLQTRSLAAARELAPRIEVDLAPPDPGETTTRVRRDERPRVALEAFLDYARARRRPKTVKGYEHQIRAFLDAHPKLRSVKAITGPVLEAYKARFAERSNATLDRHMAGISTWLTWCAANGLLAGNPPRVRRESRGRRSPPKYAEREHVAAMLDAARGTPWRRPIALGFYAGLRLQEIRHLRWRDVHPGEPPQIAVREDPETGWVPKSAQDRVIPLASALADVLGPPGAAEALVCDAGGIGWLRTDRFVAWQRSALPDRTPVGFHPLRHSFGTYLAQRGEALRNIQSWMGHANIGTTEIYMHYVGAAGAGVEALNLEGRAT